MSRGDETDAAMVITEASGGLVRAPSPLLALDGFAAAGEARETVALLADAAGAWFAPAAEGLTARRPTAADREIADAGAGTGDRQARITRSIETVPRVLLVAHYDPARDYQTGAQEARRPGAGQVQERIELPAAVSAGAARTIGEGMLARVEAARVRRTVMLDVSAADIAPGAAVTIVGEGGLWRVAAAELAAFVTTLELVPMTPATIARGATGGRVLGAPDLAIGRTVLHAFELPPLDGSLASEPRMVAAAAGTGPGWRRAALLSSLDGVSWRAAGMTAAPAVIGTVAIPPADGPGTLLDLANRFEVDLLHAGMTLAGADDRALDGGANLAMVGGELLQFGEAVQVGATRWRLGRLLRARRGMTAAHGAGERFVLLEAEALAPVSVPATSLGGTVRLMASGVGDAGAPAEAIADLSGVSLAPPAPVHLRVEPLADGGGVLRWTRRSRAGWLWTDGLDTPLGEESEAYRVTVGARTAVTQAAELPVTAAERAGHAAVQVRQIGTHATSPAATIIL